MRIVKVFGMKSGTSWNIVVLYSNGTKEIIDSADTEEEAKNLVHEYLLAFGV